MEKPGTMAPDRPQPAGTGQWGPPHRNYVFRLEFTWHFVKLPSYFLCPLSRHTQFDVLIGCFNLQNSSEGLPLP